MKHFQFGIRAVHQKNIKTAIIEAKQNGFGVLEIHLSSPQFLPQNYNASQLNKLKVFAQKNSIILQTHSEIGQSLIQADNILRQAEKKKLERAVKFSLGIGARCLTLHQGKAPSYSMGPGNVIHNDYIYKKYYTNLFEDSVKHIISIAPKDFFIGIENTDNFTTGYQKVLDKYLKTNKVFLTWDIMKSYSYKPTKIFRKDQWKFLNRNVGHVCNIHISGPSHGGIEGYEKDYVKFFKLFRGKNIPVVIERLSLKDALATRKIILSLEF